MLMCVELSNKDPEGVTYRSPGQRPGSRVSICKSRGNSFNQRSFILSRECVGTG